MDKVIVKEKLDQLRYRLGRIQAHIPPHADGITQDSNTEDIIVHNFCQAVQLCVDIALQHSQTGKRPSTMSESFGALEQAGIISPACAQIMKDACHIRNIAMHSYTKLDLHTLHSACTLHFNEFSNFAKQIQQRLRETQSDDFSL